MAIHHGALNCATQAPIADPNVLDDYEEGTWTPQVVGTGAPGAATYDFRVGTYTKIGRLVFFNFNVAWTAHTGTGDIQIAGLPFSSAASAAGIALYVNNLAFAAGAELQAYAASTDIFIKQATPGGGASGVPMTTGQIGGSGFFYI
jgi:hypothetical protein